jgi:hypothetical protein
MKNRAENHCLIQSIDVRTDTGETFHLLAGEIERFVEAANRRLMALITDRPKPRSKFNRRLKLLEEMTHFPENDAALAVLTSLLGYRRMRKRQRRILQSATR